MRISTRLHDREGKALTNFAARLPEPDAEAAQLITRDPYTFEFVDLAEEAREKDLERALVDDLEKFLRELGAGFAFVGSQVPFEVDGEDFYIGLLFFHIPTCRYVVIDLKLDKFKPKDAGQINFYVNVVDDRLRLANHAPTIGLVLCATRSETIVRYALDGSTSRWAWPLGRRHLEQGAARPRAGGASASGGRTVARGASAHRRGPRRGDGKGRSI